MINDRRRLIEAIHAAVNAAIHKSPMPEGVPLPQRIEVRRLMKTAVADAMREFSA